MATREAACLCGQLRLEVDGDPWMVSICHCLSCQRRTGSAFGMQAAFRPDQVRIVGNFNDYSRISDEADRKEHVLHFCPACGSQVFYTEPTEPDLIVISVGSFADPSFPPPTESGYDWRRHPWVALPDTIERFDLFGALRLLYEAGEHAEAADRAQELVGQIPTTRGCCTTSRAAKASPGAPTMRSSTCVARSRSTSRCASWQPAIPTSTRSAPSRGSGRWSASRAR